jgi:16S rRNA C967 or C1407 C5-methylase (RsmB/RsmF family)/NOL1/NOP2/fmu family ribosome biogenesis protein
VAGLPEGFKNQMQQLLGSGFEPFLEAMDKPAPVSVRYHPLKRANPTGTQIPWCANGRYLDERPSFTLDPLFHAGAYYVQEASSMLLEQAVIQSVDTTKPIVALDLCAAPGGKSTHLLSLLSRDSLLFTNEAIRGRVGMLSENIEKWGYENVIVTNNDPSDMHRLPGYFDLVVVDAPCSGEGLFRKEPEAVQEWSERNVELCSLRQRRIVADAWQCLKPGGVLIYSTCTYNDHENIDNLAWMAGQYDLEFVPLTLDPAWGIAPMSKDSCIGYQCFPHRVRGEGFFFSVARKTNRITARNPHTRSKLRGPAEKELGASREWVTDSDHARFFLHGPQVRFLSAMHEHHLLTALDNLHVIQAGTGIGEITKNKVVPDYGLALSIRRNLTVLPGISLSREQALAYLRRESLTLEGHGTGFHVVEYEGLGLGWVNVLPGRVNNLFPSGRRVRKTD